MTLPLDIETPAPALGAGLTPDGTSSPSGQTGSAARCGEVSAAAPVLTVIAHGTPGPQGSKDTWVADDGKARTRESSKKVKPWRKAVREAAQRALPLGWTLLDEPLEVEMVFTLQKGVSIPKRRRHPAVYPDLSKLARSTEDALTGVVWKDDARVVRYRNLAKCYPLEGRDALNFPGVVVRIYRITEEKS